MRHSRRSPTPPSTTTRRDYSRIVEQAHGWHLRQCYGQGRVWRRPLPQPQQGADAGHPVDLLVAALVVCLLGALAWQWWPRAGPPARVTPAHEAAEPVADAIYVSAGGHGDVPSDSYSCEQAREIATPRQTIAGGLACLTVPGQTLYIRGGTYHEAINLMTTAIPSGRSREHPTRIAGYAEEYPHLHAPAKATSVITVGPDTFHMAFERLSLHGGAGARELNEGLAGRPHPPEYEEGP